MVDKLLKEKMSVVRAGRGLRMVLNREGRERAVAHPLGRSVVEVDMGPFNLFFDSREIDGEAVILRRDLDPLRRQINDRLISPMVAELEFKAFPAQSQT